MFNKFNINSVFVGMNKSWEHKTKNRLAIIGGG